MDNSISRRSFVAGAAAASAAAGAAAMATSVSAARADEAAPARWSWENGPEAIDEASIVETVEHEFVVVGAGLAGLATAASLAENGGDVVVVEKCPTWSARSPLIAMHGAFNSPRWVEAGVEYSKFDIYRHWDAQSNSRQDAAQVWTFLERSGEAMEWSLEIAEKYDGDVQLLGSHYFGEDNPEFYGTYIVAASDKMAELDDSGQQLGMGNSVHFALYQHSKENGCTYFWNMPGKQLVQDETGAVKGVICQNEQGDYVRFMASKGVVLATGDCSGDEEMNACFSPIMNRCHSVGYLPAGANTGDGQKMAIWAGAKMQDAPWPPMIHPQGYGMILGPFMMTDSHGRRFMNEDTWTQGKSLGILNQPGNVDYGFCVFDANYAEDLESTRYIGGGLMWDTVYRNYGDDSSATAYHERILGVCDSLGNLYKGDTIEEAVTAAAADYPTLDADQLVEQIARYNELVEKGEDEDFGKRSDLLFPIAKPPFYVEKVGPNRMVCPGGAIIRKYGQVIDAEENPIEGLYAVGNVSGGLYAVDYTLVINGNSHGRCITFGYLLGRQLTGVEE